MFSFEKLEVWHEAIAFADTVYSITKTFPDDERFGLTNQMRRAAVSISSNITEGSSRSSRPDFARFIEIATGSVFEVVSQATISRRRDGTAKGGADCEGRVGANGLAGGRTARAAQGALGQGSDRSAAAAGDDPEFAMDRGALADGKVDLRVQPAERESRGFSSSGGAAVVSIVRTDTCQPDQET